MEGVPSNIRRTTRRLPGCWMNWTGLASRRRSSAWSRLATDFPQVVREIAKRGHEVGCHSNEHTWLNKMTEEELRRDTTEAVKALQDVSGQKVVSFRAPAFSITTENKWAVNVLADCGIESDASIFPTSRDFGGYRGFPQDTPCIIRHEGATLERNTPSA